MLAQRRSGFGARRRRLRQPPPNRPPKRTSRLCWATWSSHSIRRRWRRSTRRPSGKTARCSTAWTSCEASRMPSSRRRFPSPRRSRCATTSDEENAKILNALGRVAPADGQGVDYDATWVRHVGGDLKSSNPLLRSSVTEFEFQTYDGLQRRRADLLRSQSQLLRAGGNDRVLANEQGPHDGQGRAARRPHLVGRQADHGARRRILVQSDHDGGRADPGGAARRRSIPLGRRPTTIARSCSFTRRRWPRTTTHSRTFPIIPKHIYEKSIAGGSDDGAQRVSHAAGRSSGRRRAVRVGRRDAQPGIRRPPPRELLHARRQASAAEAVFQARSASR